MLVTFFLQIFTTAFVSSFSWPLLFNLGKAAGEIFEKVA